LREGGSSATDFVTDVTDVTEMLHHFQLAVGAGDALSVVEGFASSLKGYRQVK